MIGPKLDTPGTLGSWWQFRNGAYVLDPVGGVELVFGSADMAQRVNEYLQQVPAGRGIDEEGLLRSIVTSGTFGLFRPAGRGYDFTGRAVVAEPGTAAAAANRSMPVLGLEAPTGGSTSAPSWALPAAALAAMLLWRRGR